MARLQELARKTGVPVEVWQSVVSETTNLKTQFPEPRKGQGITVRAAARKYGMPSSTISRWVAREDLGIKVLQQAETRGVGVVVDEHDLWQIVEAYKRNPGRGRRSALSVEGSPPSRLAATA